MCGIAGLLMSRGGPPPAPDRLAALGRALAHRGPDGSGQVIAGQVGLVHTRLAIIDLATGDQPFTAGPATLIANGEIYNFRELAAAHPAPFATGCDCEVPLHLYLEMGARFPDLLRGMYALAVHDRASGETLLARDRFGIKPLYTARIDGGLAFASEPAALLATGLVPRTLHARARAELLQLQFTTGSSTIFTGIDRVLPGETLRIAEGRVIARDHLPRLPCGEIRHDPDAALARLDAALMRSVDLHQRSDVPYGLFLSGGIDSAVILAAMARLNTQPVLAFTAGWDVPGAADERDAAAATARAAGARHETIEITQAMVWRHLPQIVAAMDDPAADYAIIPSWFLARHAREQVKVVLSGEGGDEVFAGYGRYRSALRPVWLGGRAMRRRGTFDGLDVLRLPLGGWRDGIAAAEAAAHDQGRLRAAQATDMTDWLPHDLLLKLDRCLMAHGVEGRTPFLDPDVLEAGFCLPDRLKIRDGQGKYLLRRWLEGALPACRPFAPKQGFTVPIAAWIEAVGGRLGPLVAAQPGIAEIAAPDRVRALFARAGRHRHGFAAWTLLFYALWHRAHIEGRATDGDVFEVLA